MEKISKKQRLFVTCYAWGHCFMGVVCVGVLVLFDLNNSASGFAKVIRAFTFYLYSPFIALNKVGIQLPSIKFLDYLWLYFAGLMFGYLYLFIYKLMTRR